jgi:DNA helicase-2/ATP-dependent DNA helicase PcrA
MSFIADLHLHSHLSRATSRDCTLEGLYRWAQLKGIRVVGTGDFTHPQWCAELQAKLVPSRPGLYRLRDELAAPIDREIPPSCRGPVEFLLSGEISSIYKRAGRTRKVHSLLLLPDLASVERLNARLGALGNIRSDGRPILGVDPRDLLSLLLEAHAEGLFIPAHIWTPWFSLLGSMSGFDSPDECFGDLVGQVFAVETGLSSDPPMNWRVSSLDRFALVSNSDLHSPANLGRNASLFHCEVSFFDLRAALRSKAGDQYGGTIDLFPEEGKYHADGHRKCGVCLEPEESRRLKGLCPACGRPLVLGVLHRVTELADRPPGARPPTAADHEYIIPLPELLAELLECGDTSQRVTRAYEALLRRFGPELRILRELPLETLAGCEPALLAEAIRRVRARDVIRQPGYDGEYGVIRVFRPGEMDELRRQGMLIRVAAATPTLAPVEPPVPPAAEAPDYRLPPARLPEPPGLHEGTPEGVLSEHDLAAGQLALFGVPGALAGLSPEQRRAAGELRGPVLIVAGPGIGKTRTLARRIAHLVADRGAAPETILAVTFTNRAAGELRERLRGLLGARAAGIATGTFHGLCLAWLRRWDESLASACLIDDRQECELLAEWAGVSAAAAASLQECLSAHRRGTPGPEALPPGLAGWDAVLQAQGLLPLEEIVPRCVGHLRNHPDAGHGLGLRWLCVDEFQDSNPSQYQLVRLLAGPGAGLCVIGDPDQSIYGFRGADPSCFEQLRREAGDGGCFGLGTNYRSTQTIVAGARAVVGPARTELSVETRAVEPGGLKLRLHAAPTVAAEAEFIAHEIERWLGGTALFSIDSGRVAETGPGGAVSFGDIAVLVRLKALVPAYAAALGRLGVPVRTAGGEDLLGAPGVRRFLDRLRKAPRECLRQPAESALASLDAEAALSADEHQSLAALLRTAPSAAPELAWLVDRLLLRVTGDDVDVHAEQVNVMTMHAAKGLEFPIVFIAGCEEGVVPYRRAGEATDEAEERRLFYVAMTRARQVLYLTRARRRVLFGRALAGAPSPFLEALPAEQVQVMEPRRSGRAHGGAIQLEFDLG